MAALCLRARVAQSALHWFAATAIFLAVAATAAAEEPIVVHVDQARILKLPERAATVVIGNPLIADLSIQPGGLAVVTGKAYGATNVVVMDKGGAVMMEKTVEVAGPSGEPLVVVYRGATRQTYSCTPDCAPRITLGDTSKEDVDKDSGLPTDYFNKALNQSVTRSTQAMAAGAGGAH